jgi:phosphohistidine phosphatase
LSVHRNFSGIHGMQLYIVRHAYAGHHGDPQFPDDDLRPLTDKGRKRFRRMVKKLARRGFAPAVVATSPLIRCRQTADVIAERLDLVDRVVELDLLCPQSELEDLIAWTNQQAVDCVAWVGHSPDVEHLVAALIGAQPGAITFAKGAVAAIEFENELAIGEGELQWFATPKSIGC